MGLNFHLSLILLISSHVLGQTVPCYNEVLINSQVEVDIAPPYQNPLLDLSSDPTIDQLTQFGISGWIYSESEFTVNLLVQATNVSPVQTFLSIQIEFIGLYKYITLKSDFDPTTSKAGISNGLIQWSYMFISVTTSSKICLDLVKSNPYDISTSQTCLNIQNAPSTFETFKFEISASGTPSVITRTIFFHRNYILPDEQALAMLMRSDSKMISEYLFTQQTLSSFIIDSLDVLANNVNIENLPIAQIPLLFDKGLEFSKGNSVTLGEFPMTPYSNEFQFSFSLQTSVEKTTSFLLLKMTSTISKNQILTITLKNIDIFYDQIIISLNGAAAGDKIISQSNCQINRIISWNKLLITGYSFPEISSSTQEYSISILINGEACATLSTQTLFDTNTYQIQFGDPASTYDKAFSIKTLRIYSGSYSPNYSVCNSRCPIMQRREHTPAEYENLSQGTEMNGISLNSTLSLACLQCANNKYYMEEYCVEGASSCTKFVDFKSYTCSQYLECSNPTHSQSDCIYDCEVPFFIGNTGTCNQVCHYSCTTCTSKDICLSTGCPSTRVFNPLTNQCDCLASTSTILYYDDGLSLDCIPQLILATTPLIPKGTSIISIYDIKVSLLGPTKSIAELPAGTAFGSGGPIFFPTDTTKNPVPDLEFGLILKSTQSFKISGFSSFSSIRFWIRIENQLGRPSTLLKMISTSSSDVIFSIGLNTYDDYRSAMKLCFFKRCMFATPKKLSIYAAQWSQLSISFEDSALTFIATVFLNGSKAQIARFQKFNGSVEKFKPYSPYDQAISYDLEFGDEFNSFTSTTSFIALRYISFFSDPISLVSEYSYPSSKNCVLYAGSSICLLCKKGYRFSSFSSKDCEIESTTIVDTTKFYYEALRMVHVCALDTIICTECQTTPIICKNCVPTRGPPSDCNCLPGTYPDSNLVCQTCSPACSECSDYTVCTKCGTGRMNMPSCNCQPGYFSDPVTYQCTACDSSCVSCDPVSATCTCPDLASTYRYKRSDNRSCPCLQGYYDPEVPSKICESCFKNCSTCNAGNEDSCLSCKIAPNETNAIDIVVGSVGQCLCKDSNNFYLSYNGVCKPYVTVEFSILIDKLTRNPIVKIKLSEQIEFAEFSQWEKQITFEIFGQTTKNRRILASGSDFILSKYNDPLSQNIGYILIQAKQSVRVTRVTGTIVNNRAIRSMDGIPLKLAYSGQQFSFEINPFIFTFDQSDLSKYNSQVSFIQSVEESGFAGFLRSTSILLLFFNFMQAIASLLFIQTVLPIRAHLLVCQFAGFLFPHTPRWLDFTSVLPPQIYGLSLESTEQNYNSYIFQQMGISSNFLFNITESFVLFIVAIIAYFISKKIDMNRAKQIPIPEKKIQHQAISITLNLVEIRLIYILLSIFTQIRQPTFFNALYGISTILAFIFFGGFLYLSYLTKIVLNSTQEKEEFKYSRTNHLVDFIEHSKHTLMLNYKLIQFMKKLLYFGILIMFQDYPKVVIILSLILSLIVLIFDIITRPFKIKWISYTRIVASLTWAVIWILIYASHIKYHTLLSAEFLIDPEDMSSFQAIGNALFYSIMIYTLLYIIILSFKVMAVIYETYKSIVERKKNEIIYLCEKLKDDGQYQQVQLAYLNLDKGEETNNVFHKNKFDSGEKDLSSYDKFLFNFKQSNLVKPTTKKVL